MLRSGLWPDGSKIGRGYPNPYLRAGYALDIAKGLKTSEGRPGGVFLEQKGTLIAPDDYIHFKISGHRERALVVSAIFRSLD